MSLTFRREQQNIYLDTATHIDVNSKIKYNIILSPNLYWVKRVSLPVKYVRDVKKLVHTLFEETIPKDSIYSYYVYKKGDDFFIFAYNDKEILSLLELKGITSTNVNAIYFAQSELDTMQSVYKANDAEALQVKDSIVMLLPTKWFETLEPLNVADLKLSKEKIKLHQFHHLVDGSVIVKMTVLLLLFIAVFGMEFFIYMHQKEQIMKQKEKIFAQYQLKPTMMQNKAILNEYERICKTQKKIRKTIVSFLRINLSKEEKIENISYKNRIIKVTISHLTQKDEKRIMAPFYKQKRTYNFHISNGKLFVEVKI